MSSRGVYHKLLDGRHSSSRTQKDDDLGLLAIFGSKMVNRICTTDALCSTSSQRSPLLHLLRDHTSNRAGQIPQEEDSHSVYPPEKLRTTYNSTASLSREGVIMSRKSQPPLSEANASSITRGMSETSSLTLSHSIQHIGSIFANPQNTSNFGACLNSLLRHHFHISQIHCGLLDNMPMSLRPVFQFIPGTGSSTSQLSQAPSSSEETGLQRIESDGMRQHYVESALFMYWLADSLFEGSLSFMVLASGFGVNIRLESQDNEVFSQSSLFNVIESYDHYRDMRLDVDMSYEELLALEDHIGSVSIGLSVEVVNKSLKRNKYFSFVEEDAYKECCSICQEDYEEEDELGTLICAHGFHIDCIKQWLKCKNLWPICKSTGLYTTHTSFSQTYIL